MDADIQEHKRVLKKIHAEKQVLHLLIKQAELLHKHSDFLSNVAEGQLNRMESINSDATAQIAYLVEQAKSAAQQIQFVTQKADDATSRLKDILEFSKGFWDAPWWKRSPVTAMLIATPIVFLMLIFSPILVTALVGPDVISIRIPEIKMNLTPPTEPEWIRREPQPKLVEPPVLPHEPKQMLPLIEPIIQPPLQEELSKPEVTH